MSINQNHKNFQRYIGIDLIRLAAMFAIVTFHFIEATYWQDTMFFAQSDSFIFNLTHIYSRQFSFSGFVIVGLTTFLMGFNDSLGRMNKKNYSVFAIVCFGGFVLFPLYWGNGSWVFEWDIYHFLIVALGLLILLRNLSINLVYIFGVLGFIIMCFPLWRFEHGLQDFPLLHEIILGVCSGVKKGTWPLLPWLGLPCFAFAMGIIAKKYRDELSKLHRLDLVFLPLLILSLPNLVVPYNNPDLGEGFYCFMNRQGPVAFWSNFIWIIFFIRLSINSKINQCLYKIPLLNRVPQLGISKSFGLFYITQITVIQILSGISIFQSNATISGIAIFLIIPFTEIILKILKIGWQSFRYREAN